MQAGSSTERSQLYEQKHYSEILMIPAAIGVLLSFLDKVLAVRCPILIAVSQSGAAKWSKVLVTAAVKHTAPSRRKNPQER